MSANKYKAADEISTNEASFYADDLRNPKCTETPYNLQLKPNSLSQVTYDAVPHDYCYSVCLVILTLTSSLK